MILIVGLSSAWQRTIEVDGFEIGEVNRATRVTEHPGGKGVNAARVATQLGADARLLTIAGGRHGELLTRSLKQQGIRARIVTVAAETRVCQTLIAKGKATELVEECGALTKAEVDTVLSQFETQLAKARLVVLIGTVPPGCGDDFYEILTRETVRRGVPVLVDTQGKQLLNAIREKPFLVRINRREVAAATRMRCERHGETMDAGRKLVRMGAQSLIISNGAKELWMLPHGLGFHPPRVAAVNPVGSGDAMMAGLACALHDGKDLIRAVHLGMACGAANALTPTAGSVRRTDVNALLRRMA